MTKTNKLFAEALSDTRSGVECARLRLRSLKANRRKLNRIGSLLLAAISQDSASWSYGRNQPCDVWSARGKTYVNGKGGQRIMKLANLLQRLMTRVFAQ